MTCVAGIVHDGKVTIGGDSAGVCPVDGKLQLRKDPKVFRNGEYLIGVSGSWQVNHILRFTRLPDGNAVSSVEPFMHMVKAFLPAVKEAVQGCTDEFELLVGFHGRLFHVYNTGQVSEEQAPYEAIGSGDQVARGALHALALVSYEIFSERERIEAALTAAERFCSDVRGPFTIIQG
jgi:ATP-dependent protease HslVU (ClpYQ) peptidase subunit